MKHQLSILDLTTFESKTQIAGSFGNGENKSLSIVTQITTAGEIFSMFVVENKKVEQLVCTNLEQAIVEYNKW